MSLPSLTVLGYWIPFEAAKAVAARFCWEIRYALTPVFGTDFPSTCVTPDDPNFLKLKILSSIVGSCTERANGFRMASNDFGPRKTRESSLISAPKTLRPKPAAKLDYESGYGTDSDRSVSTTPRIGLRAWTVAKTQNTKAHDRRRSQTMSPHAPKKVSNRFGKPPVDGAVRMKRMLMIEDGESVSGNSAKITSSRTNALTRRQEFASAGEEARAAYALMALWKADQGLRENSRTLERRASW